jgi:hypothetical protein
VTRTRKVKKKETREGGSLQKRMLRRQARIAKPASRAWRWSATGDSSINGSATSIPTGPPEMLFEIKHFTLNE